MGFHCPNTLPPNTQKIYLGCVLGFGAFRVCGFMCQQPHLPMSLPTKSAALHRACQAQSCQETTSHCCQMQSSPEPLILLPVPWLLRIASNRLRSSYQTLGLEIFRGYGLGILGCVLGFGVFRVCCFHVQTTSSTNESTNQFHWIPLPKHYLQPSGPEAPIILTMGFHCPNPLHAAKRTKSSSSPVMGWE